MEKLFDFDGMFEEKLAVYMKQNAGKYTESQWERKIPKLYQKFGDIFVAAAGDTPKGYYAKMDDITLAETLKRHYEESVPVSDFLTRELEKRGCIAPLLPLILSGNDGLALAAVSLAGGNPEAFEAYFTLLQSDCGEEVKSAVLDQLRARADDAKAGALDLYRKGIKKDEMLEILSCVRERDDETLQALLTAFRTGDDLPLYADYLAAYGDEQALPVLIETIAREDLNFLEFREIKYAIEALGGEYNVERDFSEDTFFLEISRKSEEEGEKKE